MGISLTTYFDQLDTVNYYCYVKVKLKKLAAMYYKVVYKTCLLHFTKNKKGIKY